MTRKKHILGSKLYTRSNCKVGIFALVSTLILSSGSVYANDGYIKVEGNNYQGNINWDYGYTGNSQSFTVPVSGTYQFEVYGAQGEDYASKSGGYGGSVTGYVNLTKGDVISITVGGKDGYNGGGSGKLSNGGGATQIERNGSLLAIAGGGGGATDIANGNAGGSTASTNGEFLNGSSSTNTNSAGGGGGYVGGNSDYTIYHSHSGDTTSGGSCYNTPTYHEHVGNSASNGGCYTQPVYHIHEGEATYYGGCYTNVNYHEHKGSASSGGGCYTVPVYHVHQGNKADGGSCYETAVMHEHSSSCNYIYCTGTSFTPTVLSGTTWYICNTCGAAWSQLIPVCKKERLNCDKGNTVEYYALSCELSESTIESYDLGCGMLTTTPESYSLACNKTEDTVESYEINCGKELTTVTGYILSCSKTENVSTDDAKAAYGGSNYYDSNACTDVKSNAGVNAENGRVKLTLYAVDGAILSYFSDSDVLLKKVTVAKGETASYPFSENPQKTTDEKYSYTFVGWDDLSTEVTEYYTALETTADTISSHNFKAIYTATGQTYTVELDNQSADSIGTQSISATYEQALPDIDIPVKNNYIFAGYYTQPQGNGTQYYNSMGKAIKNSDITDDTILYAHWLQPLALIKQPIDVALTTGYRGVIIDIDSILTSIGDFSVSYQWYQNEINQIDTAWKLSNETNKNFALPENYAVGNYYFFCAVTVTDNTNNHSYTAYSDIAKVQIEKGQIAEKQVLCTSNNIEYDGKAHSASVSVDIASEYAIYYSREALDAENYLTAGNSNELCFTDAGTYEVYYYITSENYKDYAGKSIYTISKAKPEILLMSKNVSYTGEAITLDEARVSGVNGSLLDNIDITYTYYIDANCTQKTSMKDGAQKEGEAPTKVGSYYVIASVEETNNYIGAIISTPALLNIFKTTVAFEVKGYTGVYNQEEHSIFADAKDNENIVFYYSTSEVLTANNYKELGTTKAPTFKNAGTYKVYYLVVNKLTNTLNSYIPGEVSVIIYKANQYITEDNYPLLDNETYTLQFPQGGEWEYRVAASNNGWKEYTGEKLNWGKYELRLMENENYYASEAIMLEVQAPIESNGNNDSGDKEEVHVHNYELIHVLIPTTTAYGREIYRCTMCGELLILELEPVLELPETGETEETGEVELPENNIDKDIEKNNESKNKENVFDETDTSEEVIADNSEENELDDTNHNGIPDIYEQDNNGNGIPDIYEADNNGNGIPDYLEWDTNGNGVPDYMDETLVVIEDEEVALEEIQTTLSDKIKQTVKEITSKENVKIVVPCVTVGMVVGLFTTYFLLVLLAPFIKAKTRYRYYIEALLTGKTQKYTISINSELAKVDSTKAREGVHFFRMLCTNEDYILTIKDKNNYSVGVVKLTFMKKRVFHEVIINQGVEIQVEKVKNGAKVHIR